MTLTNWIEIVVVIAVIVVAVRFFLRRSPALLVSSVDFETGRIV